MVVRGGFEASSRGSREGSIAEKTATLRQFIAGESELLQAEGVPVDEDMQIDLSYFEAVPGLMDDVEDDLAEEQKQTKKFYGTTNRAEIVDAENRDFASRFEMLASALLQKFIGDRILVVRTSRYDDTLNHVDTLLIDRKTGKPICGIDEVVEAKPGASDRKKRDILPRNLRGGANIKYGVQYQTVKKGKSKLSKGSLAHVPIMHLSAPEVLINRVTDQFVPDRNDHAQSENQLFAYFLSSLNQQSGQLQGMTGFNSLPTAFRESISVLNDVLKEVLEDKGIELTSV